MPRPLLALLVALAPLGCARVEQVTAPPPLTPTAAAPETAAMLMPAAAPAARDTGPTGGASLWTGGRASLLGDRRALERGDILTVVIEIDEGAEFRNSSQRQRNASQSLGMPSLFGLPQVIADVLPSGATLDRAVGIESSSSARGDGSVRRNEKLELRIAAVVTDVLPNGALAIRGSQEVRVNFELRELIVSGIVRPMDISRQNEVTYDRIASARVSYGGRGQITDVQSPRPGQQVLERALPF